MNLLRSDIIENFWMALATLRANKLRSILTVVGVVIGVWTVMAIASIISGIDLAVTKEIESFGTRSIILTKYETGIHVGRRSREERMRKDLTYDDAMALRSLPSLELSVPFLDITNSFFGQKLLVSANGKTSSAVNLQGTLPDYERAGIENIAEGRWFSQFENDSNEQVCVIGSTVAEDSFLSLRRSIRSSRSATKSFACSVCLRSANSLAAAAATTTRTTSSTFLTKWRASSSRTPKT